MSKGFKGSVVLTQDSPGVRHFSAVILPRTFPLNHSSIIQHCSISASSLCTTKYIRGYFHNGTLPEPGTICQVEDQIWPVDGIEGGGERIGKLSNEDAKLLDAARGLSRSIKIPRLGMF